MTSPLPVQPEKPDALQTEGALKRFLTFSPGPLSDVRVFFAPGRVNLIGEHTDYNGGYVLPAALDMGTWLYVRLRDDHRVRFASTAFERTVEISLRNLRYKPEDDYANYPKGVIREFQALGFAVPGMDILLDGNLPNGAGLSSSASVEVATAWMLGTLLNAGLSPDRLALLAQSAENGFVGVNCGIMDQFAVALGKRDHAIWLNCDTLSYEIVPIQLRGLHLIIANTNKRRGLSDSKYNQRRRECDEALRLIQAHDASVRHLADVGRTDWPRVESIFEDETLRKRARHVVLENDRAKRAADVLRRGDVEAFGQLMNASHRSLRDDYEVTGMELDTLAELAWAAPGCVGARMTGAGFGGCTVNLVQADKASEFIDQVGRAYEQQVGYAPTFYITSIGDGAREVTDQVVRGRA
ncbi:MAG: galactokinase [Alicyclobacillus sp.]|nr:galactokinase [Alicyclobacillus sp.]